MGTDDLFVYLEKYGLELDPQFDKILKRYNDTLLIFRYPRKPWSKFITAENQKYCSNEAIDFLDNLLRYDHQDRILPLEAMAHAYFDPVGAFRMS